jgi:hypothetical protein
MIMNRMSEKARQELLLPGRKKNMAERSVTLKHNPPEEFRLSAYRTLEQGSPTRIIVPGGSFASALADAALDTPGATKAQMQRLTRVPDINVPLYGLPELFMAVVRTAGINKTPDIRTRAIFKEWAAYVHVTYVKDLLTERSITNLFAAAGFICGIGDWRGQKGGSYGSFELVNEDNKDFQRIIRTMGKSAQDKGLKEEHPYDYETEELLSWFRSEMIIREKQGSKEIDGIPVFKNGRKPTVKVETENGELVAC